jgi:hypothetical protein
MGGRRHGQQGSPADRDKLTTFAIARDAAAKRNMAGVGLALMPDAGIVALDFDNCVLGGRVDPEVLALINGTYAEYSPSGTGVRAFFWGAADVLGNKKSHTTPDQFGAEVFSSNGFVTCTGHMLDHIDLCGDEDTVAQLPQRVIDFCAKRFGPSRGALASDDFTLGRELPLGLSAEQIERILNYVSSDCGRDEWLRVGFAIHHECQGDDTGLALWDEWSSGGATYPGSEDVECQWSSFRGPTPGRPSTTMASVIQMAKKGGYVHTRPAEAANQADVRPEGEWPHPLPLPDALLPVPPMLAEMLPKELQPWLTDIAERMSVPLDFVAIPAMVMLGALIGRKVLVRPQERTDWSEPANLWGAIVSPPGAMKTPVVAQVLAPIKKFEAEAQQENRLKLSKYELDLLINTAVKKSALSGAKGKIAPQSQADIEQALMNCAAEPPKPKLKRFITTDATVEKLGEICADNPNGILYHRDELPTLFADLQREEKAPVRGFLLTGWAGLESYTFDRIMRGTTHIEAVNISLFGTAQPQRIANLVTASTAKHDDGMIQRLQLLAWPDLAGDWVSADRSPDAAARDAAFACCQRLSEFDAGAVGAEMDALAGTPFLRLSDEARKAFEGYRAQLEAKFRSGSLPEHLCAHLAKFRGLVPRLALILHLAGGGLGRVTLEAMCVAIQWALYLEDHAKRMYASADMVSSDTARLLLRRIRNGELRGGFSKRDITQKDWSGLRDPNQVERALATLQEFGWLRCDKVQTSGRPKEVFQINPAAMLKVCVE